MSWYTPMPVKNGSVVMHVDVSSNGLGPLIPNKRCPSPRAWGRGQTLGGTSFSPDPQRRPEETKNHRAGRWL